MEIKSKAQFFELWRAGLLGNRNRLTKNPKEAWSWDTPTYGFRMAIRGGGGQWAGVTRNQFWETVASWDFTEGVGNYFIDDAVPSQAQTLQGEICRTYLGLQGFLGRSPYPMRIAIAGGYLRHYSPIETLVLLNEFMDPSSRDDVDAIFDLYPDSAIEFACFSRNVGVVPGRNTIFWEVRNY